ncbi:MAG: 4-hydroxy-tetrahydrodipicolinate synthase [Alphaproteobacteria bacterium]|nr:4-hydroxy-tetrahydrodipicolinate synthase [Alphaproteobacteria bacterium]MCL2505154.1 4-hydroxy-tetrahydrodipicolinate synthase [Alphaproteobacteria bacterium]
MFKGVYTAIVTPFSGGHLDEAALSQFIDWQIQEGVHGIVAAGTTGEAPTLSDEEYKRLLSITVSVAAKRVPVIAGTGSNSTQKTIETTLLAKELGADAALVVAPYYNKPTQQGLKLHFEAVAKFCNFPVVVYNVPGRCGVDIDIHTMAALSRVPNIVGVKDATADLGLPVLTRGVCGSNFSLLSGENGTFGAFLAQGGDGGILVTSNVVPRAMRAVYDAWVDKDIEKFANLNLILAPLHKALFSEPNPIPIKYAVSKIGKCKNELRLPLCPASTAVCEKVDTALDIVSKAGYV